MPSSTPRLTVAGETAGGPQAIAAEPTTGKPLALVGTALVVAAALAVMSLPTPPAVAQSSWHVAVVMMWALACIVVATAFALILRRSNRRQAAQRIQLDVALNHMVQGLCMFDAQARLVMCNERYLQMFNLSPEDVRPGVTVRDLVGHRQKAGFFTADPDQYVEEITTALLNGQSLTQLRELADGRAIHVVMQPIATGGWVATHEDITERRKTELERDRNREFLDRVIENIPSIVLVKNTLDKRYLLINKAGEQLLGMPRSGIIGRTVFDFFDPEVADMIAEHDEAAVEASTDLFFEDRSIKSPSGHTRYMTGRTSCIRAGDGTPQYLLTVMDDVTEQRSVRQQLQQAQRMEAVGRLTGALAHDFNNLLLVIIGNLDLLFDELRDNPAALEMVHTVLDTSLRGADLTRQLLAFSERQSLLPKRLQPNELIRKITKLLHRTLGDNISVELKLAADLWPIMADEAQLEAALVDIAINARDAMPNGGKVLVETRNARLDQDYCSRHRNVTPGDFVEISVSDNGTGMPPDVLARIFEPFFTTKGPDRGTGLSLSTVFGFLRQSGGHVDAYSEVGAGTTVKLYLPRGDVHNLAHKPFAETGGSVAGESERETILVVEDNASIRAMVVAQLKTLGYRVFETDNAAAAMELLSVEKIDLLFTDIVMPGDMNGKHLARAARSKHPMLKVLFTSGLPGAPGFGGAQIEPGDPLLQKPYRRGDLANAVRTALDGGQGVARDRVERPRLDAGEAVT